MALGALEQDLNRVLKAIDKLRLRKTRPNLPALSRYLYKSHNFSSDKIVHLLDILLARNKVKEIVYKGNISYRNMLNWREPVKPSYKNLESQVNSSVVVTTMLKLIELDREEGIRNEGIEEARLQAALIEQLDGAVKLQEIRKQIELEVTKKTIEKNKNGYFILGERDCLYRMPTDNVETSSDSMDFADGRGTSSESTNDESSLDTNISNMETSRSTLLTTSTSPKPKLTSSPVQNKIDAIKNLEKAIDNVVKNMRILKEEDLIPEEMPNRKRKYWEIAAGQPVPADEPTQLTDNKRRRIIRKKTIYDPSEFELTPLIRRNKRRAPLGSGGAVQRGRGGRRPRGGRTAIKVIKEEPVDAEIADDKSDTTNDNSSSVGNSPEEKQRCRGKPPAHINKKCCICSAPADKTLPSILSCSLCLNIAHKDCVKNDSLYKGSKKWRCEDCNEYNPVICTSCELYCNKDQVMLMCDFCEEFYHAECHYPPVKLPLADSTWRCATCPLIDVTDRVKIKVEVDEDEYFISAVESKVNVEKEDLSFSFAEKGTSPPPQHPLPEASQAISVESLNTDEGCSNCLALTVRVSNCDRHKPDEPIPTVDDWTAKQVSDYFLEKFDQNVADAFLAQDIDGKLLKQISRQYVTDDLGLQFGIALKVLYYVKKIQLGTNLLQDLWASS